MPIMTPKIIEAIKKCAVSNKIRKRHLRHFSKMHFKIDLLRYF
jgi:hypothetical protein